MNQDIIDEGLKQMELWGEDEIEDGEIVSAGEDEDDVQVDYEKMR